MKILILGQSEKFIKIFSELYPNSELVVFSWRCLQANSSIKSDFEIVVVCGYDYDSYFASFENFLRVNVYDVIDFLENLTSRTKLIYIDTADSRRKYTFSRYLYAKKLLAVELYESFIKTDFYIIKPNTIVNENNAEIKGGILTQIVFYFLINLNLIKTTSRNDIALSIKGGFGKVEAPPCCPIPVLLNWKRTKFLDRLLRFIYG